MRTRVSSSHIKGECLESYHWGWGGKRIPTACCRVSLIQSVMETEAKKSKDCLIERRSSYQQEMLKSPVSSQYLPLNLPLISLIHLVYSSRCIQYYATWVKYDGKEEVFSGWLQSSWIFHSSRICNDYAMIGKRESFISYCSCADSLSSVLPGVGREFHLFRWLKTLEKHFPGWCWFFLVWERKVPLLPKEPNDTKTYFASCNELDKLNFLVFALVS